MSGWPWRRKQGVLSLVERGWSGARTCSLMLNIIAIPVTHLIKGWLNAEHRAMIQPRPHIRIISVPRPMFRIGMWLALAGSTLTGRLRWVLIDQERTHQEIGWWCRLFGIVPLMIRETHGGYELEQHGRPVSSAAVFLTG